MGVEQGIEPAAHLTKLMLESVEGPLLLDRRKAEDEPPGLREGAARGQRVVGDGAAELEARVRLLRVTRDDTRLHVEVRRAAGHQIESALEASFAAAEARYPGEDVERPPHWGGYRLTPHAFEFWQGRRSRLHDRIVYRHANARWQIGRLAP